MLRNRKLVVTVFVVAIVLVAVIGVVPAVVSSFTGPGLKTEGLSDERAQAASTDIDGDWQVVHNRGANATSVGFTFPETLPGDKRVTSGSTQAVDGTVTVAGERLEAADISVDMTRLQTDNERRDINVRMKIFETDEYPTADFTVTDPVDLSGVPRDGSAGTVPVTGELTIHGVTRKVTSDFDVLRDGDKVVVATTIPVNRTDFDVETPDFVAATIAEDGEINVRLTLEKTGQEG